MSQERKYNSLRRRCEVASGDGVSDLRELLSRKEEDLNKTRVTLDGIRAERDQLRRKVHNLLSDLNRLKRTNIKGSVERLAQPEHGFSSETLPISKKAERVKLKKTELSKPSNTTKETRIHGTDLDPAKLSSSAAEQVVHGFRASSETEEIFCQIEPGHSIDQKLQEKFELKMDKVRCQFQKLRSENNLLHLTLQESKSKTEQLQMLLSKYESNNTAHTMTLFYSELISETFNALLAILEKDVLKKSYLEEILSHTKECNKQRMQRVLSGLYLALEEEFTTSQLPHNLSDFIDGSCERVDPGADLTSSDILTILELRHEVQERKRAVMRSIVNLDSFSIETLQSPLKSERTVSEFDLENAVLLHELASIKEELANLKAEYQKVGEDESKSTSFENPDSVGLDSKSSGTSSFDFAFNGSVQSLNPKVTECELNKKPAFLSLADLRIGTMTESELGLELSEAIKREERLKKENDRLAFTLQQIQQNSEKRHVKSMEVMSSLKLSYSTLLENSRKDKLKHASRVKDLERLLAFSEEEYKRQIDHLKQRILVYERERENLILPDNETAL